MEHLRNTGGKRITKPVIIRKANPLLFRNWDKRKRHPRNKENGRI
jgi:hypothetical protein